MTTGTALSSVDGPAKPLRVLIVEDDPDLRPTLADLLSLEGFEVRTAGNGREALDSLAAGVTPPDVLLVDWLMPVMDGEELLAALAQTPSMERIPVVVLSGARDIDQRLLGHRQVRRTLTKPVAVDAMVDALRSAGRRDSAP